MKYLKSLGIAFLYVIYYIAMSIIVTTIFSSIVANNLMKINNGVIPDYNLINTEVMKQGNLLTTMTNIVFVISIILFFIIRKKNLFSYCQFKKVSLKTCILSALFGLSFNFLSSFLTSFIDVDRYFPEYSKAVEGMLKSNIFIFIITICIAAPIAEELLFRGLIFSGLKKVYPVVLTVIIESILFGVFHMNMFQGIYTTIFGIALTLVLIKYNSIWASIIAHAFYNFRNVLYQNIIGEQTFNKFVNLNSILVTIGIILFFIVTILILKDRSVMNDEVKSKLSPL